MSKESTHTQGQSLVEYVLVLGLLAAALAVVSPVLKAAVIAVRLRFLAGVAGLP